MNGLSRSELGYKGNALSKRIIASLSAVALALGLCLTGFIVTPLTAKAASYPNPTITETEYDDSIMVAASDGTWKYAKIPADIYVLNTTKLTNGQYAYVPYIYLWMACKPVTSTNELKRYFPRNKGYKEGHPSINGRTWIPGDIQVEVENIQFGQYYKYTIDGILKYETTDDPNPTMAASSIAFQDKWFEGHEDGKYRYQIFLYEPVQEGEQGTAYPTFRIANLDTAGNRMFVDMYVKDGIVKAVVLVDEDDNKMPALNNGGEDVPEQTTVTPTVGGAEGTIIYNVVDVNISNTILGENTNGFTYAGSVPLKNYFCFPAKLNTDNADDLVVTGDWNYEEYKYNISLNYNPNKDIKGFNYTLKNFPLGWDLTMAQTTQTDVEGKLQVYEKNTSRWTKYDTSPVDWINTIASANSYTRIKNQDVTLTSVSYSNNKIGFVNAVLESTPETGIAFQVLPYILMAAGAGVLLLFIMRRRADTYT